MKTIKEEIGREIDDYCNSKKKEDQIFTRDEVEYLMHYFVKEKQCEWEQQAHNEIDDLLMSMCNSIEQSKRNIKLLLIDTLSNIDADLKDLQTSMQLPF